MLIYTLTTGKGGRPQTYFLMANLLEAVKQDLIRKRTSTSTSKIIIEVKQIEGLG